MAAIAEGPGGPALRFRRLWLSAGWLMVAAVVIASLVPIPGEISPGGSDKAVHMAMYGVLMLWFAGLYWAQSRRFRIALGLIAMGVLLEVLQGATDYRTFEYADMAANAAGVGFGWIASLSPLARVHEWFERLLVAT